MTKPGIPDPTLELTDEQFEGIKANLTTIAKNNNYESREVTTMTFGVIAALTALGVKVPAYWYIAPMSGRCIIEGIKPSRESWDKDNFQLQDENGDLISDNARLEGEGEAKDKGEFALRCLEQMDMYVVKVDVPDEESDRSEGNG